VANEEQEQTLNQILTEMDGFDPHTGVIVLAATNRADVLDAALAPPWTFRPQGHRAVSGPAGSPRDTPNPHETHSARAGRQPRPDRLAHRRMVGADLRNLANEAALAAARRDAATVAQIDFTDALEKVELGSERQALIDCARPREDRVPRIRPRVARAAPARSGPGPPRVDHPRGQSLGVTVQSPVDDRFSYGEDYLRGRITGALGGRAAEELVYGIVTTEPRAICAR